MTTSVVLLVSSLVASVVILPCWLWVIVYKDITNNNIMKNSSRVVRAYLAYYGILGLMGLG